MKKQWIPVLIAAVLTLSACGGAAPAAPDSAQSAFTPVEPDSAQSTFTPVEPDSAQSAFVPAAPEMPDAPSAIGPEEAKAIALAHAGVSESDAVRLEVKRDRDEYDVEFYVGRTEYSYEIDAASGEILSFEADND